MLSETKLNWFAYKLNMSRKHNESSFLLHSHYIWDFFFVEKRKKWLGLDIELKYSFSRATEVQLNESKMLF